MKDQHTPVEGLLPHRYPFLFVDELTEVSEQMTVGKRH